MRPLILATILAGCDRSEPAPAPTTTDAATDELADHESEARVSLSKLHDAASAFYAEEHVERDQVAAIGLGGQIVSDKPHRCPNDGRDSGSTAITPPLEIDCASGPDKMCWPSKDASSAGHYPMNLWTANRVWNGLNFQLEAPHRFHYRYRWDNKDGGCEFVVQAIGRGSSGFRIYERSAKLSPSGARSTDLIVRHVTRDELED